MQYDFCMAKVSEEKLCVCVFPAMVQLVVGDDEDVGVYKSNTRGAQVETFFVFVELELSFLFPLH